MRNEPKDIITEEDFNRVVIARGNARPEDDSKGDSAVDNALEVELGEHFVEEQYEALDDVEEEDRGVNTATSENASDDDKKLERQTSSASHTGSSTWPTPEEIDEVTPALLDQ